MQLPKISIQADADDIKSSEEHDTRRNNDTTNTNHNKPKIQTEIVYAQEHEEEEEEVDDDDEEDGYDGLNNLVSSMSSSSRPKPKMKFGLQINTEANGSAPTSFMPKIKIKSSSDNEESHDQNTPQSASQQSQSCELSSTLANEKSSLLERYSGGSLDVDNLIERLIANNSSYHVAYYKENGCTRNAREYHTTNKALSATASSNTHSFSGALSALFNNQNNDKENEDSVGSSRSRSYSEPWDVSVQLEEDEMIELCYRCRELFAFQPMLLELEGPLKVVGDIHGQYFDLLRIFEYIGFPSSSCSTNYLFLGDYVDRGKLSIETIVLLFAYKYKYPENFFLLRGNHEASTVNRLYGFYDECKRRFSIKIWKIMCDVFNCLPICALIEEKIFAMHGGLSPQLKTIQQIKHIQRPTEIPDSGLLCDLLWSDPNEDIKGWDSNERGVSYIFGKDVVNKFLRKHDLDLIARAHQVVEDGYEFFAKRKLVTIFSAPNYCGEFDNCAGIMSVDQTLMCSFQVLQPFEN
eukprot:607164_1